jgi:hypothetical protein
MWVSYDIAVLRSRSSSDGEAYGCRCAELDPSVPSRLLEEPDRAVGVLEVCDRTNVNGDFYCRFDGDVVCISRGPRPLIGGPSSYWQFAGEADAVAAGPKWCLYDKETESFVDP